jgi:predicted metal-binding membrane protein
MAASGSMMQRATPLEAVLKKDRMVVAAGIAGLVALACAYVLYRAWDMTNAVDADMAMAQMQPWGVVDFVLTFSMWAVMMTAMMIPTAAPMILLFAKVHRSRKEQQRPFVPTGIFLLGYLAVWSSFAAAASVVQWGLHSAALLSPMLVSTNPFLGGALLVAAGLYQWSPLKHACLSNCRSPLGFLMAEWREGAKGTFVMGLRHGAVCLGCCWVLMALLFVLGVMNLLWIAALASFVLIEKVAPAGAWVGRLTGFLLAGWGAWMIVSALG